MEQQSLSLSLTQNQSKSLSHNYRRDKYPASRHHFYFNDNQKDYLLFINETSGYVVMITEGITKQIAEFEIEPIVPIHFVSTGVGDITILHQKGICMQSVYQLATQNKFQMINIEFKVKPKKMIKVAQKQFIIVSGQQTLLYLLDDKITKEIPYPAQLKMQELIWDNQRRQIFEVRLIVPSLCCLFPYVFSGKDILEWDTQNYFQNRIKKYSYQDDQKLPEEEYLVCFSAVQSQIYFCNKYEVIVLSIKKQQMEGIDYVAQMYFRYKNPQCELQPIFISASHVKKSIVHITTNYISEKTPMEITNAPIRLSQKGKDVKMTCGYGLTNQVCVFLCFDKLKTRLLVV